VNNRQNCVNGFVHAPNTSFAFSATIQALCASGLEWDGDQCNIHNSLFSENGNHQNAVSDGLTLLQCQNGLVTNNAFFDNSDVNFIMGCGTNTVVRNIEISMASAECFAGFMLDNFNNAVCGNYQGLTAGNIQINCGTQLCDFGANFGPHPWYPSSNIVGGQVFNIAVVGAKQGINIAGAGTAAAPFVLMNATLGPTPASAHFDCGVHATSPLNVAPDSDAQLSGTPVPTRWTWNGCA
jgi:hypothetical protein